MDISDVLSTERGARFFRGDLHIHSFGASHDVTDSGATPTGIVALAKQEGLDLIALTDHNEISGVAEAIAAGAQNGVFVVPGVELSTAHGHLLCYLPTLEALTNFFAGLTLADRGTANSRCSTGMRECLDQVKTAGGFAVLAHIDGGKGLETELPGFGPHKKDIICHPALLGIELVSATSDISYSDGDPVPERKAFGRDRIAALKLGQSQFLARVLNSDAHSRGALGRNAANQKKITRYKMQSLSFSGLRMALEDADARVRIEEEIPTAVPLVRALALEGGFLAGQYMHFSPNLNCIIGGRGTGKSTAFEIIRLLVGQPGTTDVVDSDVWPDHVDLIVQDQSGQLHRMGRAKGGPTTNANDPEKEPHAFPVECYGQGETQSISQKAQSDPAALLDYLDRFVDVAADLEAETVHLQQLLDLQSAIEKAERFVAQIPQTEKDLALKKSQLDTLEKANAKDVIALVRKLEGEKQLRSGIREELKSLLAATSHAGMKEPLEHIAEAADPANLQAGKAEYEAIVAAAKAMITTVDASESKLKVATKALETAANAQLETWMKNANGTVAEIEQKKKELAAQNIHLDMAYINRLTEEEAQLTETLRKLTLWKPERDRLRRERAAEIKARWATRARIATRRSAFARKSSETLNSVLADLHVSLKFEESAHSPDAEKIITEAIGWRTSQVPRAAIIVRELTMPKLLAAIGKNDSRPLTELSTPDGAALFTRHDAEAILAKLGEPEHLFRLERVTVVDRPVLTVTRPAPGSPKPSVRDFSKLSLGQQQSVLLALMLSVDTERPLVIDQPEDNLDSEFIYRTLVPVLRRAKERRQIIVVTHNANIAVLGDAEQILVLKSTADRGWVVSRGSIDNPETKDYAVAILEGSDEAFRRRARVYGVI